MFMVSALFYFIFGGGHCDGIEGEMVYINADEW